MHQTQRMLKVLQSHPIGRAPSSTTSLDRSSPTPAFRRSESFDVLDGFRRELDRVRKDVASWATQEREMEERQRTRMEQLAATTPTHNYAHAHAYDSARPHLQPPSASLMSTISNLIHSPPKSRGGSTLNTGRESSTSAFSLAPSVVPSPFASLASSPRSSTRSLTSSFGVGGGAAGDPHLHSLAAKGSQLLDSESHRLDASQARLESLLKGLHAWKEARSEGLRRETADLESRHADGMKRLIEQFESDRSKLESNFQHSIDAIRQRHAREVEAHVAELNQSVEKEFERFGELREGFKPPNSNYQPNHSHHHHHHHHTHKHGRAASPESASALDRSMRLEHLLNAGNDLGLSHGGGGVSDSVSARRSTLRSDSPDDARESARAKERRKRMAYSSALNGSSSRDALTARATSASATVKNLPPRQTVHDLLASSDDDAQEDDDARAKQQLIAQAQFLQSARARTGFRRVGTIGTGESAKKSKRARDAEKSHKSQARMLLESSTDDDEDDPTASVDRVDPYTRSRLSNSVRFASSTAGGNGASSPAAARVTRRRTEKETAATIFHDTSSDEEIEQSKPIGGVQRNSAVSTAMAGHASAILGSTTSGRIHGSPAAAERHLQSHSSSSSGLRAMAISFQNRVATIAEADKQNQAKIQATAEAARRTRNERDEEIDD